MLEAVVGRNRRRRIDYNGDESTTEVMGGGEGVSVAATTAMERRSRPTKSCRGGVEDSGGGGRRRPTSYRRVTGRGVRSGAIEEGERTMTAAV